MINSAGFGLTLWGFGLALWGLGYPCSFAGLNWLTSHLVAIQEVKSNRTHSEHKSDEMPQYGCI